MIVPKYIFLTKGVGHHKEKLTSYEEALRKAQIACFNLVNVSSIFPPGCKIISKNKGLQMMEKGQIAYTVLCKNQTNENRRLISASVGVAIPRNPSLYGYLSEHSGYGKDKLTAGDYAEDLAAYMLATILGVDYDTGASWDKRKEIWKISGQTVVTRNVTQTAQGVKKGIWVTVLAAAVLVT